MSQRRLLLHSLISVWITVISGRTAVGQYQFCSPLSVVQMGMLVILFHRQMRTGGVSDSRVKPSPSELHAKVLRYLGTPSVLLKARNWKPSALEKDRYPVKRLSLSKHCALKLYLESCSTVRLNVGRRPTSFCQGRKGHLLTLMSLWIECKGSQGSEH